MLDDNALKISIHALREEGDSMRHSAQVLQTKFLSTPSARRATVATQMDMLGNVISIHALREEGDVILPVALPIVHISIHALREEGDDSGRCPAG